MNQEPDPVTSLRNHFQDSPVTFSRQHKKPFGSPLVSIFHPSTPATSSLLRPTHLTLPALPFTRNQLQLPLYGIYCHAFVPRVPYAWNPLFHLVLLATLFIQHIALVCAETDRGNVLCARETVEQKAAWNPSPMIPIGGG